MRGPEFIAGAAVPLFDRFEEVDDCRVAEPYRVQDLSLLLESIQKEIANLLNTRLPDAGWEPVSLPQTILDYGLPSFSHLCSGSPSDSNQLRQVITAKIAAFEPRLQNPVLELQRDSNDASGMIGTLRGCVRIDNVNQPVCFPVSLRNHGESAAILPAEIDA